jgi:hypothetical protein
VAADILLQEDQGEHEYPAMHKYAVQTAVAELYNSFRGQPTYFQGVSNGSAQMAADLGLGADLDHDHEGEDCGLDLDAILAGFDPHFAEAPDQEPVTSSADALAALLTSGSKSETAATARVETPAKQTVLATAKSDLLTMLAIDGASKQEKAGPAAAKATVVAQLDELFTDFGMVTAK